MNSDDKSLRDWKHKKTLNKIKNNFDKNGLSYFVLIEDPKNPNLGASIYNGKGVQMAAYHARQAHMNWERSQGIDTEHDWRHEITKKKESSMFKDTLKGGIADNKKPSDFPKDKLERGMKHEMEHTNDKNKAMEIAMDHLSEDLDYYEKLKEIEKSASYLALKKIEALKPITKIASEFSSAARALEDGALDPEVVNKILKGAIMAAGIGALVAPPVITKLKQHGIEHGDSIAHGDSSLDEFVQKHPYLSSIGTKAGIVAAGTTASAAVPLASPFIGLGMGMAGQSAEAAIGSVLDKHPESGIGADFARKHTTLGPALMSFIPGLNLNNAVSGEQIARDAIKNKSFMYRHPHISSYLSELVPLPGYFDSHTHAAARILHEKAKDEVESKYAEKLDRLHRRRHGLEKEANVFSKAWDAIGMGVGHGLGMAIEPVYRQMTNAIKANKKKAKFYQNKINKEFGGDVTELVNKKNKLRSDLDILEKALPEQAGDQEIKYGLPNRIETEADLYSTEAKLNTYNDYLSNVRKYSHPANAGFTGDLPKDHPRYRGGYQYSDYQKAREDLRDAGKILTLVGAGLGGRLGLQYYISKKLGKYKPKKTVKFDTLSNVIDSVKDKSYESLSSVKDTSNATIGQVANFMRNKNVQNTALAGAAIGVPMAAYGMIRSSRNLGDQ